MAWPKPEFQLDDSKLESVDCGPASCCVAVDFMSRGKIHPSTENIRKKMNDWDTGGTNPSQWATALSKFGAAFERNGLTPPKLKQVTSMPHDMLRKQLQWGRGFVGVYDYGEVKAGNRRLWSSTSFVGLHAMFEMRYRTKDGKNQTLIFDPLADGRTIGGKTMVKGPKWWPFWLARNALSGGAGKGLASGVIVWRSEIIKPDTPEPTPPDENEPGTDPADQMDTLDKLYSFLSDLEEQYDAMGLTIDDLRAVVGPDNDSQSEPVSGVKPEGS